MSTSPLSPQRLAIDLQKALTELEIERERTRQLLAEVDRQNAELDRLRSSVHRESNSRLLAEEALDESRDRLQLAVEAAGLALWDWQLTSPQMFMTARWGEMVGDVAIDGYWDAQMLLERVHPQDRTRLEDASRALKEGRVQRLVTEHRVRGANDWIWVESHGMVAEHDSQGRPLRLMGTLADISERKRIEAQVQQARELAEQANRAKTEFLANTSHEIRTPLNALMGLTHLLMESPVNTEQRSWLEMMDRSAQTLLTMLNDVLDLSRIEAGKMEVERVRFDLPRTLSDVGALYETQARGRSIQWTMAISPALPVHAVGDPGRLQQVLGNLMSNALKFTPKGGRVHVSAQVDQGPGDTEVLKLQVQDSGVGIAPRHQATIFEAFTQADSSTARRYGGSGLGLTICARLVALMGGHIELESALGMGSTFTVRLPLTGADTDPHPPTDTADHDPAHLAKGQLAGLQVLLAEDNPVNELLMTQWLERMGCTIHKAHDGEQAVTQWERQPIDIVLMDMQMPQVSGLEAVGIIRARERERPHRRTPIVAVTANAGAADIGTCLAADMDGFVSKPVHPAALLQAMTDALQKCRSAKAAAPKEPLARADRPSPDRAQIGALDMDKLRRRLDGNEASLQQLAQAMREDLATRLAQLLVALQQQDRALAVAHAHGLKGSLGSMTAERGARLAKGLELAARSGDWTLFGRALPLLQAEASQIDAALAGVINPSGASG